MCHVYSEVFYFLYILICALINALLFFNESTAKLPDIEFTFYILQLYDLPTFPQCVCVCVWINL